MTVNTKTPDIAVGEIGEMVRFCPSEAFEIATQNPNIAGISPGAPFVLGERCTRLSLDLDLDPATRNRLQRPKIAQGVAACLKDSLMEACDTCTHNGVNTEKRVDAAIEEVRANTGSLRSGRGPLSLFGDALREVTGHSVRAFRTRR